MLKEHKMELTSDTPDMTGFLEGVLVVGGPINKWITVALIDAVVKLLARDLKLDATCKSVCVRHLEESFQW
jgi:energy-converting hydrogenase Eha subunit C